MSDPNRPSALPSDSTEAPSSPPDAATDPRPTPATLPVEASGDEAVERSETEAGPPAADDVDGALSLDEAIEAADDGDAGPADEPGFALLGALLPIQRRIARQELRTRLLLATTQALAVLALAVVLLTWRQEWARVVGWLVAVALIVVASVRARRAVRALRKDRTAAAAALGRAHPELASDLVTGVAFAAALRRQRESGAEVAEGSPSLVRAHLSRMDTLAPGLVPPASPGAAVARVVPATRPRRALRWLLAAVALHAIAFQLGSSRLRDAYRFLALGTAAPSSQLFEPEPIAGDLVLTLRYPAYTGRPPRVEQGATGEVRAPRGTVVELSARADRDVERALAVVNNQPVALTVAGRQLTGGFTVEAAGRWHLAYARPSGRVVARGPERAIIVEPDRPPEVRLEQPAPEKEVEISDVVELRWSASDDFGLQSMELVFQVGTGPEQRRPLPLPTGLRQQRDRWSWDLAPLALQPGDRVTYRVEATDNNTIPGPSRGASASQLLRVFSPTEHNREVLQQAEQLWERLLALLGDRLEEPSPGSRGEQADAAWGGATTPRDSGAVALAGELRTLGRALVQDKRAPPEIGRALAQVGDRLEQAATRTRTAREKLLARPAAETATQLAQALQSEIREEENGALYLESLIDRRKLLDLADMAHELKNGRDRLAQLVEAYQQAPTEERKREVMEQVARLKQQLAQLHQKMRDLQKGIQDEHLNEEADRLMQGGDDLMEQLDEVQEKLSQGNADDALKALQEVSQQLEKMEQELRDQAGEVDEETQELTRRMQQMASDLVDLQAEQEALREQTARLQQSTSVEQALREQGEGFIARQRERVRKAREALEKMDRRQLDSVGAGDDRDSALERLDQLSQALEARDLDEALEQARMGAGRAESLEQQLDFQAGPMPGSEQAGRAARPLREVAEELERLSRALRKAPSEADRQQMRELSEKQASLQKRTGKFRQSLQELGEKLPVFGPQLERLVDEAAAEMDGARQRLGQGSAPDARIRQAQALERLSAFRRAMQQQQQQQQGEGGESGPGVPMPFGPAPGQEGEGAQPQERVELPGGDGRPPQRLREQLIEAMKEAPPERYREKVRDYYEELVK